MGGTTGEQDGSAGLPGSRFEGPCWTFGDNIPTDQLIKSRYVFDPMDVIVQHVLEDMDPEFPRQVKPGDVVVAGRHFGQSSGRAIAAKALQATRIGCVLAESFARTFYRNCFEIGLPAMEVEGVTELARKGDRLAVDITTGTVTNTATGESLVGRPADPFLVEMLAAGGLIALAERRPELFA
jgi:3-isopropylmalate/(R)-2-methylmalate dehydratase small subunit